MERETAESATVVARLLAENASAFARIGARFRDNPPPVIVTCARGSSDHAATYGKYLLETLTGVPVASNAMSVASVFKAPVASPALCIAISQSGRSPDLLAAVEAQKRAGGTLIALVNDAGSPLAATADILLPLCAGPEKSVAATKSCIAAIVALAAIAAHWTQGRDLLVGLDALPQQLDQANGLDWSPMVDILTPARNLFVIGRGYGYGIAQEAALKLKETCALHAEAFSAAEVRHGPMTIVDAGFPVLAFATSDPSGDSVRATVRDFLDRDAQVALADPTGGGLPALAGHPALEPILMLASFYRAANALSLARGLDPDAPPHLAKVTRTV